jgi:hypothetical protein
MKWIEVLKKFNSGKGEWCIPRKGSRDHKEEETPSGGIVFALEVSSLSMDVG